MIPALNLNRQYENLKSEIDSAISRVLRSGHFILGPEVERFEEACAKYLGVRHAVGLNSGTDALVIGLRALNVGAGDEVITSPFSFFATAEAIETVGATPVFADVQLDTFNLDPADINRLINNRTKCVIPVHLFGRPADLYGEITQSIPILDDAAQSFGAMIDKRKIGSLGRAATFSFFPTKNLGAAGDAGLLVTNDDTIAQRARALRTHGSSRKYYNQEIGYNSRLDALQAAILGVKLPQVDAWTQRRREIASQYRKGLAGLFHVICPSDHPGHVYHQFTLRVTEGRRDALQKELREKGIETTVYYPLPIDALPVYRQKYTPRPNSLLLSQEVLSLPIWPEMEDVEIQEVLSTLRNAESLK